jgi:hypothetical protein
MKSWLITFALAICLSGCASQAPIVKTVLPEIPPPPQLESMVPDKNDATGDPGFWLSRPDAMAEAFWRGEIQAIKRAWGQE